MTRIHIPRSPEVLTNVHKSMADDNQGPELLAIIWTFTAISIATVILKLFTRRRFLQGLGWDDFFIFISLVSSYLLVAIIACSELTCSLDTSCYLHCPVYL